ncbi:MAG: YwiC-like family protein [Elusimicrobiota bacterium]
MARFIDTIPPKHGAWIVLIAGYLIGTAASKSFHPASLLLLLAAVSALPAQHTAGLALRELRQGGDGGPDPADRPPGSRARFGVRGLDFRSL